MLWIAKLSVAEQKHTWYTVGTVRPYSHLMHQYVGVADNR